MRRGDVVVVAAAGYYGKPLPAVILQTDALPGNHASVVVCPLTSYVVDAPDFRVTVDPTPENRLATRSQGMARKPLNDTPGGDCPPTCPPRLEAKCARRVAL